MSDQKQLTRRLYGKSKYKFERKPKPTEGIKHEVRRTGLSFVQPPSDIEGQNKLIQEMVEWAMEDETAMDPEKFPIMKRISPFKFKRLAETNEFFAEGLDLVKHIIAVRLKEHVRERKIDKEYLFKLLPLYSHEFRELQQANRQMVSESIAARLKIVLDPIPSSDLVPQRIEENNE